MSEFVDGRELLTGGGVGVRNRNFFSRGPKIHSRGPPRAIFPPRGPNCPIHHYLPISRGPFFFARGPFMARGLLFEKHWSSPFHYSADEQANLRHASEGKWTLIS